MSIFTTWWNINNVQNDQILFVEKPWTLESQVTVLHVSFAKNLLAKIFSSFSSQCTKTRGLTVWNSKCLFKRECAIWLSNIPL